MFLSWEANNTSGAVLATRQDFSWRLKRLRDGDEHSAHGPIVHYYATRAAQNIFIHRQIYL